MIYQYIYQPPTPFSNMIIYSDGTYLTGLWFVESKDTLKPPLEEKVLPIFKETEEWLNLYFGGIQPKFMPQYRLNHLTPFRKEVLDIMNTIEYGSLVTYQDIAKQIAQNRKIKTMSSQAVGGAVGWNPICIILPCHRVVGKNGRLTGYSGGIHNKIELLKLEGVDLSKYVIPKRGV